ncbi:dihydrodipicolinate synthase family protein [Dactylosporangium matsuzakiense]|uniref:Dihydrodipicolinate synthase family protein n=1 Tax=Dactylosporangium matsuzakiense TaxID=53360 RepID=A0A9W6KJP1_9ACTN|nr:dihydrodipicolinate synthase family protein [Dactylosporangium matsuzakiense]GLL02212.1 dihydrodipicolinate synthase family protein [Dactylosporangium matsuzakiense]
MLTGTWYISPTPFTDAGDVDAASLERIVAAAASWGVDGITILGVMGEAADLTAAERETVLSTVAAAAAGTVPFAVGCSAPSAAVVAANARRAAAAGAAAVMISAPPLLKDTDQIAAFYRAADAGIAVIVQDEPAATGVNLPVSALLAALDASGSTVVKLEDPPTPPKIGKLLAQRPDLTVFGGLGGVSAYSELRRGAAGTMTGFAYPEILRAIRLAFERGDRAAAARIYDRFLPYIVFEGQLRVGLGIRKEVLRRRGVIATARTRALNPLPDEATLAELDDVLARVGLTPSIDPFEVPA